MSNRLPSVEALRAFGAISVLWMHCIWLGPWDFPRGLGAWSYGIYLWHLPVLLMLKKANFNGSLLFLLTLSITVTVTVAAASYRWFEPPCMQGARRRGH